MITIMITESKVIEIFCIADDFCKEFDVEVAKKLFVQLPMPRNGGANV